MDIRYAASPAEVAGMSTDGLRQNFLVSDLFVDDEIRLTYTHHDRMIVGGASPVRGPVVLQNEPALKTDFFLQRRELAVVNVGGQGTVLVENTPFLLEHQDCLYVGQGVERVEFAPSAGRYYLVSAVSHQAYPSRKALVAESYRQHLGDSVHSNERTVYRFIHREGIRSSALVLGLTVLDPGSVWNTIPAHTHDRRTEIYLYFDLDPDHRVIHLMGQPDASRHLVVANREAVISPSGSIHAGAGTSHYAFIWAMAGENDDYTDMELVPVQRLT